MTSDPEVDAVQSDAPPPRPNRSWIPPAIGLGLIAIVALVFFYPNGSPPNEPLEGVDPKLVRKVHHTPEYSIMELMETETKRFWLATPRTDVQVGDRVVYNESKAEKARNFPSPSLKRTFEEILLVPQVFKVTARGEIVPANPQGHAQGHGGHGTRGSNRPKRQKDFPQLARAEGGQTVAEIAAEPRKFADKTVKVRGVVVSASYRVRAARDLPATNWYRLDDGSGDPPTLLRFTSPERLKRDEVVVITGKLAVNKRYPSGLQTYKMLVEHATIEREDVEREKDSPGGSKAKPSAEPSPSKGKESVRGSRTSGPQP